MESINRIFLIILIFFTISCENKIPETDINCSTLEEKDGILYEKERKFTGSCFTLYDFNLEKDEIRSYKKGLKHGMWVKYYGNGYIQYIGNAKKGEIHGKYTGYYINGNIKEEGRMKMGFRDGNWILNNEDGELIRIEIHRNKMLMDVRDF